MGRAWHSGQRAPGDTWSARQAKVASSRVMASVGSPRVATRNLRSSASVSHCRRMARSDDDSSGSQSARSRSSDVRHFVRASMPSSAASTGVASARESARAILSRRLSLRARPQRSPPSPDLPVGGQSASAPPHCLASVGAVACRAPLRSRPQVQLLALLAICVSSLSSCLCAAPVHASSAHPGTPAPAIDCLRDTLACPRMCADLATLAQQRELEISITAQHFAAQHTRDCRATQ